MADSPGEPRYARAIDEHAPDPNDDVPDELELNTEIGDVLLLTEIDAPEGWIHCRNEATGEEGLVPETYLELIVPSRADDEEEGEEGPGSPGSGEGAPSEAKAKADGDEGEDDDLMAMTDDFAPQEGALNEVKAKKGELVRVMDQQTPDGWVMVMVESGETTGLVGLVPEAYLGPPPSRQQTEHEKQMKKALDKATALEAEVRVELQQRA